eukprot:15402920-Alexandrium_andersonii.AAC.1
MLLRMKGLAVSGGGGVVMLSMRAALGMPKAPWLDATGGAEALGVNSAARALGMRFVGGGSLAGCCGAGVASGSAAWDGIPPPPLRASL